MEPQNLKGELLQNAFQYGYQPCFGNLRDCGNDLPLRHFVYGVDVINTFDAVEIALTGPLYGGLSLMNGVNSDVPRLPVWFRPTPFSDRHLRGSSLIYMYASLLIAPVLAQVVDVRHRNRAQPLESQIGKVMVLAMENLPRRRS